jgi:hypothetical protein
MRHHFIAEADFSCNEALRNYAAITRVVDKDKGHHELSC